MNTRAGVVAGGAVIVVAAGLTTALVLGHSHSSNNPAAVATAQRVADSITVPGLNASSSCADGRSRCFADSGSVMSTSNAVFEAMQKRAHVAPRLRCFPHYVGASPSATQPDKGTLVDSCVIDVAISGHLVYGYVDPVTTGPAAHPSLNGSTVNFAIN